jgi:diadenosine tetraphosphate (Ap4A) HIT family hydrolase
MSECIFCRILSGEAPASIVYRDADVCTFMDIRPMCQGHVLVIPTTHSTNLGEVNPGIAGQLFVAGQRVASAIRASELEPEGINLYLADGAVAGQEIFHVHLHVLPRFRGDGFGLRFAPGYGRMPPRAELDDMAARIRVELS